MSATLMIEAGGEQMVSRAVTPGRDGGEEITFAQSFGDRVGLSTAMQTEGHASDFGSGLRTESGLDHSNNVEKSEAIPEVAAGGAISVEMKVAVGQSANATTMVPIATTARVLQESPSMLPKNSLGEKHGKAADPAADNASKGSAGVSVEVPLPTLSYKAVEVTPDKPPDKEDMRQVAESTSVSQKLPSSTSAVDVGPIGKNEAASNDCVGSLHSLGETGPAERKENLCLGKGPRAACTSRTTETHEAKNDSGKKSKSLGWTENATSVVVEKGTTETPSVNPSPAQVAGQGIARSSKADATATEKFADYSDRLVRPATAVVSRLEENPSAKTAVTAGKYVPEAVEASHLEANQIIATGSTAEMSKVFAGSASVGKDDNQKIFGVSDAVSSAHAKVEIGGVAGVLPAMSPAHVGVIEGATKFPTAELNAHPSSVQGGLEENIGPGAVLDGSTMSHRTLLATPTALEVGVSNSTEGWLKIRVEMADGGTVNASLSSTTSAGQEMLHRDLPTLTAYLQQERIEVAAVVVHANADVRAEPLSGGGVDQRGQDSPQQNHPQQDSRNSSGGGFTYSGEQESARPIASLSGLGGVELLSSETYAGGGSWLSVRA